MNKQKKILFVHPSLMGGGAERVAIALSGYFVSKGHEFTFLLTKDNHIDYEIPDCVSILKKGSPSLKPIEQIFLIRKTIKQIKPDIVISFLPYQNMYTIIATWGLSVRIILSVRNDPMYDFPGNRVLSSIRNFLYSKTSKIVFQTSYQMKEFPTKVSKNGICILNPISQNIPMPYEGERRKVITTAGRLEDQKNHAMTLHSFARFHEKHPDYTLEIFGTGSKRRNLEELTNQLNIADCVHFMGFSENSLQAIRTSALFVMSSTFEGLSNAMLEALCMGVPTICTRCHGGGAEEIIKDGNNGFLVPINDIDLEFKYMNSIISNKDISNKISKNGSKLRNMISLEEIGKQWESLL